MSTPKTAHIKELYLIEVFTDSACTTHALMIPYFEALDAATKFDELERVGWTVSMTRFVPASSVAGNGDEDVNENEE